MAENVQDATIDILRNIQASIADLKTDVDAGFDRLETALRKDRRNAAGMLVMMRATAGDFDERVTELEDRMNRVEARKG